MEREFNRRLMLTGDGEIGPKAEWERAMGLLLSLSVLSLVSTILEIGSGSQSEKSVANQLAVFTESSNKTGQKA